MVRGPGPSGFGGWESCGSSGRHPGRRGLWECGNGMLHKWWHRHALGCVRILVMKADEPAPYLRLLTPAAPGACVLLPPQVPDQV